MTADAEFDAVADAAVVVSTIGTAPRGVTSRYVIAIDGPSGAGKTTLAAALADLLTQDGRTAQVVHLDDYLPGWDGLDGGITATVDWILRPLAAGAPARWRRWDWERDEYAEWHDVPDAAVLIVEGCGSGARVCAPYVDLIVWVDAGRDLRFHRGIARDGEGYRPHWQRWADQETATFAREDLPARADLRFET